ncbi:MAG TPA: hypothetical protein VGG22_11690 [Candidatus Baltobacteraceae bacterium]
MSPRISVSTFARMKFINGFIFIALGIFVLVKSVHSAGIEWQAISAYALAGAMLGLGVVRIVSGLRTR